MSGCEVEEKSSVSCPMTKDLLMEYTFVALCIIAAIAVAAFGITALIITVISVLVAVACDYLLSFILRGRAPLDIFSSAVAGMIVALSFSSGIPYTVPYDMPLMEPNIQYVAVAVISAVTVILFKKLQGLLGRKYLNPAAMAKLLVLAPIYSTALLPQDHLIDITSFPILEGALQMCYSFTAPFREPLLTLTVLKNHGWLGGASSIAVILVGAGLILFSRRYIKWKIPIAYLATIAIISVGYGFINGEDIIIRMAYHLFVGSVIFLAFFMATDPATTPITGMGQLIFAIGLGVLTIIFQMYFLFLGGSILALVIMNLTTPILDRIGVPKPSETRLKRKFPRSKKFTSVNVYTCIRCGKCLQACCKKLSPIFIKEAADKGNWIRVKNLRAEYCEACGHCSYVCPSRIDLKNSVVAAKQKIQKPD